MNRTLAKQIALRPFPSGYGWEFASMPLDPDRLRAELGLELTEDSDDLDAFSYAALYDDEVGQLVLQSYHHPPSPLTLVIVDAAVSRQRGLAALRRLLGDVDIDWVVPAETAALRDLVNQDVAQSK